MHLKRNKALRSWPIKRKGTKFLVVPSHNQKNSIPLLIILREMMDLVKTRREAKKIIFEKKVKVNGKIVGDEKLALSLLDILTVGEKNYRIILKNKKFALEETKEKDKIAKIIGKKVLGKDEIQINLSDGRNFLSKEAMNVGDSVVIFESKFKKIIKMKEGAKALITKGKHLGEEGTIEKIDGKKVEIKLSEGKINLDIGNVMVV